MTLQSTAAPPITPISSLKERYVMPTKQHPVGSGFGPATPAKEALYGVDLTGTIAIVTGGYAGIGLETTRALAGAGATVVVPVRGPERAHNALSEIPRVEQARIDLLNPESIDLFVMQFLAGDRPVHILNQQCGHIGSSPRT